MRSGARRRCLRHLGHARGGAPVREEARVVVGADSHHSIVAKAVGLSNVTRGNQPRCRRGHHSSEKASTPLGW